MTKKHDERALHEMVGAIMAMKMVGNFVDAGRYSLVKQIKDSKAYATLGVDWKNFCSEHLGRDQKTVNGEIKLLEEFGEPFLKAAEGIRLDKRDLYALGSGLSEDAKAEIKKGVVTIGDTSFKLSEIEDNAEEFGLALREHAVMLKESQANLKAIERVNKENHKTNEKLQKRLDKHEKKKTLGSEEEDFLKKIEKFRTGFDGYMLRIDPEQIEELNGNEVATPRMRAAYIEVLGYMSKQLLSAQATAEERFGDPAMLPGGKWPGPKG